MKAKPWQIALIVIGLAVGLVSAAWFVLGGDEVQLDRRYFLIDVETGDIYDVDSKKYRLVLPAMHPESGRVVLVGVQKDATGVWFVPPRDRASIAQLGKDVQVKAVDKETGTLLLSGSKPTPYRTK